MLKTLLRDRFAGGRYTTSQRCREIRQLEDDGWQVASGFRCPLWWRVRNQIQDHLHH